MYFVICTWSKTGPQRVELCLYKLLGLYNAIMNSLLSKRTQLFPQNDKWFHDSL
jgi:hypothetical protein